MLAIETTLPAQKMIDIVRAVASPAVSIYYDVSNAVWNGYDTIEEMEALHAASMLPRIHVKDGKERTGDAALGEGRAPYPAVAAALRRLGYEDYLVFETPATDDPVAAALRHIAYMRDLLGS